MFVCYVDVVTMASWVRSHKRRVTVNKFRGALRVDIREFYDKDGVPTPGRRGECCSRCCRVAWRALRVAFVVLTLLGLCVCRHFLERGAIHEAQEDDE